MLAVNELFDEVGYNFFSSVVLLNATKTNALRINTEYIDKWSNRPTITTPELFPLCSILFKDD